MSKYRVLSVTTASSQSRGEAVEYVVNNCPVGWDHYDLPWPSVAKFPVGIGYCDVDQHRRAQEYADYMNKTHPAAPSIGEASCK
jgi:hypothetical protein